MTQTQDQIEQGRDLVARGATIREAAAEVGVAKSTLHDHLRRTSPSGARLPNPDGLDERIVKQELPIFERDYTDRAQHCIYPIGDLHLGAPEHAGRQLDEWLGFLEETPNVSMLNTGDNTNCAIKSSVSEAYDDTLTVGEARQLQTRKFWNLANQDKIDAIIDGNHEDRIYKSTGDSPNAAVCDALGINYDRAACIVRYLVGDQKYDLFLRHGSGGGGSAGGQVNNLEKQERIVEADIYVSGHTHTQCAFVKDIFVPGLVSVERRKRLFVCSGSFVGYEEYAAKKGFAPAHIGAPRIFLDGRRHDAHASV